MSSDPITTEVIWNTLTSVADEMAIVIERSAYSPMIRDVRDYCCALVDVEGNVLAYNSGGLVTHFADIGEDVLDGIELYGLDGFRPGDAIMMNAAYFCGQHANNVLIYTPIFHRGELVAFAANRGHWGDIGGITANRPVFGTTDAIQEGLQVRSVRVFSQGEPVEDVLRLIRGNLRQPDVSLGDMRAQVGACRIGERRFLELLERHDPPTVHSAVRTVWEHSATLARQAVEDIPDGHYEAEAFLDDDGYTQGVVVPIKVAIDVEGDVMNVDLAQMADQVMGPINSNTLVPVQIAFKALTTPRRHPDVGCLEPLRISIPPGKILSAVPPAAMGSWSWTFPTVIDCVFRALAPAIPDRIPAGTSGAPYGAGFFYGRDERTQEQFVASDILPVGWGARPTADGATSGGMIGGFLQDCPIEVIEALYPVRVSNYGYVENSGGAGRWRGGLGVAREYELLTDAFNNAEIARTTCPPWGLFGGSDGVAGYQTVIDEHGNSSDAFHGYMNRYLRKGSRVIVRTSGGGGHGDPLARPVERVLNDVLEGYVSADGAKVAYGVAIGEDGSVDEAETARLRDAARMG